MKRLVLLCFFSALLLGQQFPGAVATDANLGVAYNNSSTTLAVTINNSATTIVLTSGSRFGNNQYLTIGSEYIFCTTLTSNTFTGCSRGLFSSTAASHTNGVAVYGSIIAALINSSHSEIKAIEGALGANVSLIATVPPCNSTTGNDTYTCTQTAIASYVSSRCIVLKADTANTGTATVAIGALGAKSILSPTGGALSNGDIPANIPKLMCYDGTQYILQGGAGSSFGGAFSDLTGTATDAQIPNNITIDLATAATALASNPTDCSSNQFATTIAANGNLTCAQPTATQIVNTPAGDIAATNVQTALNELDTEKVSLAGTNTFGAGGTLNLSGATNDEAFRVPNVAGAANTSMGAVSYDTTNKNIHIGANSVDNVAGLFPAASLPSDGDCIKASVSSSVVRLASFGAVCGSGGGGGGAVGDLVLLEQHTASSSASLDFTTSISATYDDYLVEFVNVLPATNNTEFRMRVSTNGGSSYDSGSNYGYIVNYWNAGGTAGANGTSGTAIRISGSNLSNTSTFPGLTGTYHLVAPGSSSQQKAMHGQLSTVILTPAKEMVLADGTYESTTAYDAFQFYFSSGNIASGTIRVYGVAKTAASSGAVFTPANQPAGNNSGDWRDTTIFNRFQGLAMSKYPTSWKVRFCFTSGSPVFGAIKILSTLHYSATVTASTTVQFASSSTPTLSSPTVIDSDAFTLATDSTHDYWVAAYFSNVAGNNPISVCAAGGTAVPTGAQTILATANGFAAGDQTGVATIPTISNTNAPYMVIAGVIP